MVLEVCVLEITTIKNHRTYKRTAYEHHYVSGSYSSSPVVERSSELYSAYLQADCLAPLRLGPSIGCFGDGDDVATDVEGLLPGLVRPVVCGDDVAHGSNAVNLVNSISR